MNVLYPKKQALPNKVKRVEKRAGNDHVAGLARMHPVPGKRRRVIAEENIEFPIITSFTFFCFISAASSKADCRPSPSPPQAPSQAAPSRTPDWESTSR